MPRQGKPKRKAKKKYQSGVRYIKTEDNSYVPEKFYRVNVPPPSVTRYRKVGKRYIRIPKRRKKR